jgi:hypothetical protein
VRRVNFRRGIIALYQGLGSTLGNTDAHANGARTASECLTHTATRTEQVKDAVSVVCSAHERSRTQRCDVDRRRDALDGCDRALSVDPIGLVVNPSVDMRSTTCSDSSRPFSFSLLMTHACLDGHQRTVSVDCCAVNGTCFNSAAPGDARGAEAVTTSCSLPGTTSEAVMRLAKSTDGSGQLENSR